MHAPNRRQILSLLSSVSIGAAVLRPERLFAQVTSLQDIAASSFPTPRATVFVAKEIITMDPGRPRAEAVAVIGGRIAALGTLAEVQALAGDQPYDIDETFRDKVIMAGFVEQHVHPVLSSLTMSSEVISIEPWDSISGFSDQVRDEVTYQERLKAALAAHTDKATTFLSWGYHHYFHGPLDRTILDQLAPDFPVVIWHRSCHEMFLNSLALRQFGVDEAFMATFTPSEAGQSSLAGGHFFEQGLLRLLERLGSLASPARMKGGLEFTVDFYHRSGITTCCEPGGFVDKSLQDAINAVYSGDQIPFNHYFIGDGSRFATAHPADPAAMLAMAESVLGWGSGRTRYLPQQVKLFTDGAIFSQLMQMKDGYTDGHDGEWLMDPARFGYAFQNFWDNDYHIHIHNNGDLGMDVLLDNLEQAMRRKPRFDHRMTIVHFGFASTEQVNRAASLGAIVSANPYYVTALAGRYEDVGIGPERSARMVPLADVKAAGMRMSFHSDMPMAPAKPMQLVWSAVTRTTAEGDVSGPDQRIDLDTALKAITIDAAHSIRLENEVGSVTPGKLANFTILEQSPYDVAPEDLAALQIWGTVLEGRVQPVLTPITRTELRPSPMPLGMAPLRRFAETHEGHDHTDSCAAVRYALSAAVARNLA